MNPVARKFIPDEASAFYPPRARWHSAFFYLGGALRRRLALDRLTLPQEMRLSGLLAGFLVPGLAVYLRGPRLWGHAAISLCLLLFIIYTLWLGYSAANLALGLMLSVHSTGLVYYCSPLLAHEPLRARLAFTCGSLLGLLLVIYLPMRNVIQAHWFTPVRMNGQVFVVQRISKPVSVHRGDWVAYRFDQDAVGENYHGGTVWMRGGMNLGPVLALPGDTVVFSSNSFSVNGVVQTNLPHMPLAGDLVVPEDHWFIWPNLEISGHGNVGESRISSALMGLSNVPETNYFGQPFARWFWRRQILP